MTGPTREPESVPLLDVRDAVKTYGGGWLSDGRQVKALRGCSLTVHESPATITAIAGESGSGKSTLAGAILGLVRLDRGAVLFRGQDVATLDRNERFEYRRQVQAIFQDPYAVFNPFYRAKHIFNIVVRRFQLAANSREANDRIETALAKVGLSAAQVLDKYPHQLSGGQRQRMMVARAYMMSPRLIVADEPVSMVDASLRAMILEIMMRLRDEEGISFLYITHDLSTAYQVADDIYILYRGTVVESGNVEHVLTAPRHPYTRLLIDSIPVPDPSARWTGQVTSSWMASDEIESACCFYGRCPIRMEKCRQLDPQLEPVKGPAHCVACHARQDDATEKA